MTKNRKIYFDWKSEQGYYALAFCLLGGVLFFAMIVPMGIALPSAWSINEVFANPDLLAMLAVFASIAILLPDIRVRYTVSSCLRCGYPAEDVDGKIPFCPECGNDLNKTLSVGCSRPWRIRERIIIGMILGIFGTVMAIVSTMDSIL